MSVVSLSKKSVSTHGAVLLRELDARLECDLAVVQECLRADQLCVGVKVKESGGNAFHVLCSRVDQYESPQFALQLFRECVQCLPAAVGVQNNSGNTPLHCLLLFTAKVLLPEMIELVLSSCPSAAGKVNSLGETPLNAYLKRPNNDATDELCKAICRANPDGPKIADTLGNLPLHYALKNRRPNMEVVKILLRRHGEAAKVMSASGQLPLHIVCGASDDMETIKLVYEAYTDAVLVTDRHGRTALHLACLQVGRECKAESQRRDEQAMLAAERAAKRKQQKKQAKKSRGRGDVHDDYDDAYEGDEGDEDEDGFDDDEDTAAAAGRQQGKGAARKSRIEEGILSESRPHIRWVIERFPRALVLLNHFEATPVDTVLEQSESSKTKTRTVAVYGLYNDPPTARLLLLEQRRYAGVKGSGVHALASPRYTRPLQELNWLARRSALLVSLACEPKPWSLTAMRTNPWGSGLHSPRPGDKTAISKKALKQQQQQQQPHDDAKRGLDKTLPVSKNNILARLRKVGQHSPLQLIIEFL